MKKSTLIARPVEPLVRRGVTDLTAQLLPPKILGPRLTHKAFSTVSNDLSSSGFLDY